VLKITTFVRNNSERKNIIGCGMKHVIPLLNGMIIGYNIKGGPIAL
jgi:hypothetical protein